MRRQKRILILPNTNTLSHLGRAFTLARWAEAEGIETHLGFSEARHAWASRFHPRCHAVRELWEPSGISFPCIPWFGNRDHIEACVRSQEDLIARTKPDLILAIFDFVSALSAGNIPRLCINGACMLPAYDGVLGFDDKESADRAEQRALFKMFWSFAGRVFHRSCRSRNLPLPGIANELLEGRRNLIYEIPGVCRLHNLPPHYRLVGPIEWDGWEDIADPVPWTRDDNIPTAYVNWGTFPMKQDIMHAILDESLSVGLRVLMSGGNGHPLPSSPRLFRQPLFAPSAATRLADFVICTGGIGVCYTNLSHGTPSLVVPMQPEQANNGIDLHLAGAGCVVSRNMVYRGDIDRYERLLDINLFRKTLRAMLHGAEQFPSLARIRRTLEAYPTRELTVQAIREMS